MKTKFFNIFCFYSLLSIVYGLSSPALAADKSWNNEGDQSDWADGANWLPTGSPGKNDAAKIDHQNADVRIGHGFDAQTLIVGGKTNSTVTVSNFVTGNLEPDSVHDDALHIRRDGKMILKGTSGKLISKGTYKDSEQVIPAEPGLMLYVK